MNILYMQIIYNILQRFFYISGWWLTYPSEKYAFVSWDHDIHNIWKNNNHVPNNQPDLITSYDYI